MNVGPIVDALVARRLPGQTLIIGVTGSVASGKSALAEALTVALGALDGLPKTARVSTDGFLLPNRILLERGIEMRKGYPESYDLPALAAALGQLRRGPAMVPAYSHLTYDIDLAAARMLERPDILVVEGLALGLDRPVPPGVASLVDCLIYIDAADEDLESWFASRFMGFWEAAEDDPVSFYRRFRTLDRAGAANMAHLVWTGINLPNLRDNIAPLRALADMVVRKGRDHAVTSIEARSQPA